MDAAIDLSDPSNALALANIRIQLIRLEDTITFYLIERVQFPLNKKIYVPGSILIPDSSLSLFDWMLRGQERLQSLVRRYQSPHEYPFFPEVLQPSILEPINYPKILHENDVNVNQKLKQSYIEHILPAACGHKNKEDRGEDPQNYGSSATCDVSCLQALSQRIHFGKFVAESKFRESPEEYTALILAEDREGIAKAITDEKVEEKVLERLKLKAETYGTDPSIGASAASKIDANAVATMYKDYVIPLTKEVEVEYLMQRLK